MKRPSASEVFEYGISIGYRVNPEKFLAYYDAVDWKRGNTSIKDWKRCLVTWKIKASENGSNVIFQAIPKELENERKSRLLKSKSCLTCKGGHIELNQDDNHWRCNQCNGDYTKQMEESNANPAR